MHLTDGQESVRTCMLLCALILCVHPARARARSQTAPQTRKGAGSRGARTVSSMPGIDTGAPDRTATSSGDVVSPNLRPICSSTRATCPSTSPMRSAGSFFPCSGTRKGCTAAGEDQRARGAGGGQGGGHKQLRMVPCLSYAGEQMQYKSCV